MKTQHHTKPTHSFAFLILFIILLAFCFASFMPVFTAEADFVNFVDDYWSKTFDPTLCKCVWARNPWTGIYTSSCKCRSETERDRFFYYNYVPDVAVETRSESCSCGWTCGTKTKTCTRIYKYVYKPEADEFHISIPMRTNNDVSWYFYVYAEAWDTAEARIVAGREDSSGRWIAGHGGRCELYIVEADNTEIYAGSILFDSTTGTGYNPFITYSGNSNQIKIKLVDDTISTLVGETDWIQTNRPPVVRQNKDYFEIRAGESFTLNLLDPDGDIYVYDPEGDTLFFGGCSIGSVVDGVYNFTSHFPGTYSINILVFDSLGAYTYIYFEINVIPWWSY